MTDLPEALTATSAAADTAALSIEGLSEPVILRYFDWMNAADYHAVSSLFAPDGVMHPPFESAIVGQNAIAAYLEQEAKGMLLQPRQGVAQPLEANTIEVTVTGKVQTSLFGVNVNWIFSLSGAGEITSARIKLIASPQELLNLRR